MACTFTIAAGTAVASASRRTIEAANTITTTAITNVIVVESTV